MQGLGLDQGVTIGDDVPISIATIQGAANTGGGDQDFTVSGFGTPKAYLVFMVGATINGQSFNHMKGSIGGGDGTRQWVSAISSRNGNSTSNCFCRQATDESIMVLDTTNGTINGEANFVSFITDGVRFTWGNAPNLAVQISVVLFSGDDLNIYADNVSHTNGQDVSQSFTGAGFIPDAIFGVTTSQAFNDTAVANASFSYGWSVNSVPIRQSCIGFTAQHNQSTTATLSGTVDNRFLVVPPTTPASGAFSPTLEMTSYPESGFALTKRGSAAAIPFGYLALKFNGKASTDVRVFTSPTSTGNFLRTTFGFKPQFLMLFPNFADTVNEREVINLEGAGVAPFAMADAIRQYCLSMQDETGQSTTDTQNLVDNKMVHVDHGGGNKVFEATLASFDTTGYTLDFSTTDATGRYWVEFGISETITGTSDAVVDVMPHRQRVMLGYIGR